MFVTLALGLLDPKSGDLVLSSAGHEAPLLLGEEARYLRFEGGPAMGLVDDAEFPVYRMSLGQDETLILYSDGITDALNAVEQSFGEERLSEVVAQSNSSVEGLVEKVTAALSLFVGETEQFDDMTLMVLRTNS